MRTIVNGAYTLEVPDELTFAFNPNKVRVFHNGSAFDTPHHDLRNVRFSIGGRTETREAYNNKVEFDISHYLQIIFNELPKDFQGLKQTAVSVRLHIQPNSLQFVNINIDFTVVWGAIQVGDTFNPSRKLTWFRNFPQTFSFYSPEELIGYTKSDTETQWEEIGKFTQGIWHQNIDHAFIDIAERGIFRLGGNGVVNTFTATFSNTFRLHFEPSEFEIEFDINDCTNGHFLRWIDRHGFIQYYLFKESNQQIITNDREPIHRQEFSSFGRYYGGVSRTEKSEQRTINLNVPLIDSDTFDLLAGILSAPLVDLYAGMDGDIPVWLPVNITSGTKTKTSKPLQDFETAILLPQTQTQRL